LHANALFSDTAGKIRLKLMTLITQKVYFYHDPPIGIVITASNCRRNVTKSGFSPKRVVDKNKP